MLCCRNKNGLLLLATSPASFSALVQPDEAAIVFAFGLLVIIGCRAHPTRGEGGEEEEKAEHKRKKKQL